MNYEEALAYMNKVQKRGSVLGLDSVKLLLERLDNPQDKRKVIHVAGTNGKGSICTFLEAMYRAEGKKVGRYISPTLHGYLERFQIDGCDMEEDTFADLLSQVLPVIRQMEQEGHALPTAFEIETAVAFLYFLEEHVDLVLLETGMGGRQDATNVVSQPLCTVFASIGMDHMQFLGDTPEQIAWEKAGIIKESCPAVSYPNAPEVIAVLEEEAGSHNTNLKVIQKEDIHILSQTLSGTHFSYRGISYQIRMLGEYQVYNAATAIETKLLLDGHVREDSLMEAVWEGRFEILSRHPLLIRDGAHNVDGVIALKESLQNYFTNAQFFFIIGVLRDKEYDTMMQILCPMAEQVFTITPQNERGLSGAVLREAVLPYCQAVRDCSSVEEALERAGQEAARCGQEGKRAVIVAWGSLSYLSQVTVRK
ncbi:MAG: bifunctional folylpolyglutamate synthase/dihydrofolate synthase [Lachnospiraceae bacterium]|nr:bifunctional folylpolyglutamate synthase/dihydrofolate synthase [Lachnospiraceae bacterium]